MSVPKLLLRLAWAALFVAGATPGIAANTLYQQRNLVSNDSSIPADFHDPNLVNPWGIVFNPTAFVWISDNGTGRATLYDGTGKPSPQPNPLVVQIPSGKDVYDPPGTPTGIVFNGSSRDFVITKTTPMGTVSGSAAFIFATEDGIIAGWAPAVDGIKAQFVLQTPGAVYKGLAITGNGNGTFLYAADLMRGKIDVFDSTFKPVDASGRFKDPDLPPGYSPFNIPAIQGDLYVTYAFHKAGDHDETAGKGLGIVDIYDADGNLVRRVAKGGKLNAPWGVALAPANFGTHSNRLLVGNFGDGAINVFDAHNGTSKGQLRGADGKPLKIDGLWGLQFGNGVDAQLTSTLYFTAGPSDESKGLYGSLTPIPGASGGNGNGGDDNDQGEDN